MGGISKLVTHNVSRSIFLFFFDRIYAEVDVRALECAQNAFIPLTAFAYKFATHFNIIFANA